MFVQVSNGKTMYFETVLCVFDMIEEEKILFQGEENPREVAEIDQQNMNSIDTKRKSSYKNKNAQIPYELRGLEYHAFKPKKGYQGKKILN